MIVAAARNSAIAMVDVASGIGVGLSCTVMVVPSVEITMVPETWVPYVVTPFVTSFWMVSLCGCPYVLSIPALMTAYVGSTASRNVWLVAVRLPWCPTFSRSLLTLVMELISMLCSAGSSASPVNRKLVCPTSILTAMLLSFSSVNCRGCVGLTTVRFAVSVSSMTCPLCAVFTVCLCAVVLKFVYVWLVWV